jgi:serine/threonine-protein kinase
VSLTSLPADTPSRLRSLLRDCLVRDPKQRLRDIGDARLVLDRIIAGAPAEAVAPATATAASVPAWRRTLPWALAGAFAVIATVLGWAAWRPSPVLPETRVDIVTPATDRSTMFALSPDAARSYSSAQVTERPVCGCGRSRRRRRSRWQAPRGRSPFWAPDSRAIGYFAGGALQRLDFDGGALRTLAQARHGVGGTWNADGVIAFWSNPAAQMMRVSATGARR